MATDDPMIAALLRERDGYLRVGKKERAAMVDAELKRRGYEEPQPERAHPKGRQAPAKRTT